MAKAPPFVAAKATAPGGKAAAVAVKGKPKGNPFAKKGAAKGGMPPPFAKGK